MFSQISIIWSIMRGHRLRYGLALGCLVLATIINFGIPLVGSATIDYAVADKVPEGLRDRLGIAIGQRTYKASQELFASARWQRIYNSGARAQRPLWASTGTKNPKASPILYIQAFASPFTVNTMPEATLNALAGYTELGAPMAADGGDCEAVLAEFAKAGVDVDALAARLQDEGAKSFVKSWTGLMGVIESKSAAILAASSKAGS